MAATMYVTTKAFPAPTGVKQNLFTNRLFAPSINGTYNPIANMQMTAISQNVPLSFLRS